MKKRRILLVLVIMAILAVLATPVMAANETQRDNATDFYNSGVLSLSVYDPANAIKYFDEALASNTTMIRESDALLYTYQGKSYAQIQLRLYTGAIETANQGLAIYPNDANLLNNKGYAFYELGDYQDSLAAYNQALAIDSTQNRTWVNKGDVLYKMGDYQGAIAAYTTALGNISSNQPGSANVTIKLALAQKAYDTEILIVIIVILAAVGAIVYYFKRKPVTQGNIEKSVEKPKKEKK